LIRDAKPADMPAINRLSAELGYALAPQDVAGQRVADILGSEVDHLWVFEADNHIKGWIHLFVARRVASPPFAEIGGLVVSSDCRGKGIGRSLVTYAKAWAKTQGLIIRVRCNIKRNDAHLFYQKMGLSPKKKQIVFEADIDPAVSIR